VPLGVRVVAGHRVDVAEPRDHEPDAAPVAQTPSQLERALEVRARSGERALSELDVRAPDEHRCGPCVVAGLL